MEPNRTIPIDRLIPVRDAFSIAGLRLTKGYAEISAKRLKVIRNGRRTFIRASEIERYIRSLEAASSEMEAA